MEFRRRTRNSLGWVLLLSCLTLASTVSAGTPGPLEIIRSWSDQAIEIIKKYPPGRRLKPPENKKKILDAVRDYFDFSEMAKRSLGRHWKTQPPDRQEAFSRLFEELLCDTYLDRIDDHSFENEEVAFDQERIEGQFAMVKTRVLGFESQEVSVDYRLKLKTQGWRVYDVSVEGVSLVSNYRSQFDSILQKQSFDELLDLLREKIRKRESLGPTIGGQ